MIALKITIFITSVWQGAGRNFRLLPAAGGVHAKLSSEMSYPGTSLIIAHINKHRRSRRQGDGLTNLFESVTPFHRVAWHRNRHRPTAV